MKRLPTLLSFAALAWLLLATQPSVARADHFEASEPCSVVRKCSATGLDCASADRACQNEAVSRGLQVVCEKPDPETTKRFIYCTPGEVAQDSRFVWVLLVMAVSLALGGSALAYAVLKKRT
jgi:hypothetical protein